MLVVKGLQKLGVRLTTRKVAVNDLEKIGEAHERNGKFQSTAQLDVHQRPFSSALLELLFTVSGRCLWCDSSLDLFLLVVKGLQKLGVRLTTRKVAVNDLEKIGEARARSGKFPSTAQLDVHQWPFSSAL